MIVLLHMTAKPAKPRPTINSSKNAGNDWIITLAGNDFKAGVLASKDNQKAEKKVNRGGILNPIFPLLYARQADLKIISYNHVKLL